LTKSKTRSDHKFPAEKQDFKMDLLDFPDEILLEILSKLDQETVHSTVALVCKKFHQLTKSSQLLECVKVNLKTANQLQSLLDMLRDNKHLKKLIFEEWRGLECLEILKVVAPHSNLRHLEFHGDGQTNHGVTDIQEECKEVLSQIYAKLTTFKYFGSMLGHDFLDGSLSDVVFVDVLSQQFFDGSLLEVLILDQLVNAKNLTMLTLPRLPRSETLRQMAENYTCLQYVDLTPMCGNVDCSENSDWAYFLEKQCQTLTSLKIFTRTLNPMPAIFKCQNLRKLELQCYSNLALDSLGSLSNLKSLHLYEAPNNDLGKSIAIAEFQHLNEIGFNCTINLSDNDVCQIAQTYGLQVCNCYA
jgi:hypothetical protein